jgi:hypothetical protein
MGMHQEEWIHPKNTDQPLQPLHVAEVYKKYATNSNNAALHFCVLCFIIFGCQECAEGTSKYVPARNGGGWIYIH